MKRLALILLSLGVLLALALAFVPRVFAPALFERAVMARMNTDGVSALDQGLHVVLVGTGSPLPDPSRAGPMTAVVADGRLFVFDVGDGATRALGAQGLGPAQVEAVFLTHLHSDHIDGLGSLMTLRWAGGGWDTPLPVLGPEGTDTLIDGLNTAYAADKGFRVAHHGEDTVPPSGHGGTARVLTPGEPVSFGSVMVTPFRVDHAPVEPAFGYVIEHAGRKVVITGDTTADWNVPEVTRNPDILVAEALNRDMVRTMQAAAPTPRIAKIAADIQDYHMSPQEAAALGARMGAGRTVLTHIVPAVPNRIAGDLFMRGVDGAELGRDGAVYSLPPR